MFLSSPLGCTWYYNYQIIVSNTDQFSIMSYYNQCLCIEKNNIQTFQHFGEIKIQGDIPLWFLYYFYYITY